MAKIRHKYIEELTALPPEVIALIPAVQRFARRFYSHPNDIDDLVQVTRLKTIANSGKFQPGTNLEFWMCTIMRSFCTKFGVAKREHIGIDDALSQRSTVLPDQGWALRGKELELAIANLSDQYRQAIEVVFFQGVGYEDAAREFGCPIGTVKSRVNRERNLEPAVGLN